MDFRSKYADELAAMQRRQAEISDLQRQEIADLVAAKVAAGWTRLNVRSDYYGSHPERGGRDKNTVYLFAPGVVVPTFEGGFQHGDRGECENTRTLEAFLDVLEDAQYIEA